MLMVFWDSQGPILEHYMEKGVTVTIVNYCNTLRNELRPAIRSKRRGSLAQCVLLLHDNARPHTAHLTINTIRQLNWEVLEHPAYSPNLTPSDFHLFGPLKNALSGRRFAADDELKEAVHDFAVNLKLSFPTALRSLQIAGLNVSRRREIILKSTAVLMSVT